MTHPDHTHAPAFTHKPHVPTAGERHRWPRPIPVTVIRPATVTLQPLTRAQRARQATANQMAHELTDASREGTRPLLGVEVHVWLHEIPDLGGIVRDAPGLAAHPQTGAVRVGRNRRGGVVVVVLHASDWSLLLCPAQPHPRAWAFLDAYRGQAMAVDTTVDRLSVQWTDMLDTVFAALTT